MFIFFYFRCSLPQVLIRKCFYFLFFFIFQGTNVIELPDVSRVSPVGFSTCVVSLPTSGQNGSVRINGGTLIGEQDSLSSNSKEENGTAPSDSRGLITIFIAKKNFFQHSEHSPGCLVYKIKSEIVM